MIPFPLYFYPTISLVLSKDIHLLSCFSNSDMLYGRKIKILKDIDGLRDVLEKDAEVETPFQRIFSECEPIEIGLYQVNINLRDIGSFRPKDFKHQQVSTVIIDSSLLNEEALPTCRILKKKNIQIILLINSGEEEISLKAFNQGLIDQCLHKNHSNFKELLEKSIRNVEERYFLFLSSKLKDLLSLSKETSHIYSAEFASAFYNLLNNYKIKEYYLIGLEGNFLLKDDNKKEKVLLTFSLSEVEGFLDSREAEEASSSVLKRIKDKEGLSFSLEGNSYMIPKGEQWEGNFHPIYQILKVGNEEYNLFLADKK